jgi:hypothetical protein
VGPLTWAAGTGSEAGQRVMLGKLAGIAIGDDGSIYVSEPDRHRILRVATNLTVTVAAGLTDEFGNGVGVGTAARLHTPMGICFSPSGELYIADNENNSVRRAVVAQGILPKIVEQPRSTSAPVRGAASFAVEASDTNNYQWYKNGVALADAVSSSFIIPLAAANDAGMYQVKVSNEFGSVLSEPATLTVAGKSTARLVNISTRAYVGTGSDVLIAGFVVRGTGKKKLLVRGVGPALSAFGVGGVLNDPKVTLYRDSTKLAENDDWGTAGSEVSAWANKLGALALGNGSKDAAMIALVEAGGAYTVHVEGNGSAVGVALVEVFDLDDATSSARLVNISTRSQVQMGDRVQIAGFVLAGSGTSPVLLRASGPALDRFEVPGTLYDPVFELVQGSTVVTSNDNWSAPVSQVSAAVGAPEFFTRSRDAGLAASLDPGAYTVVVHGKGEATGVALVEVFSVE